MRLKFMLVHFPGDTLVISFALPGGIMHNLGLLIEMICK
jgi:hypothetical protein